MCAAGVLGLKQQRKYPNAIVSWVYLETPKGLRKAQCLIDSGAERNFVSQQWIKENDVPEDDTNPKDVQAIDGRVVRSYGAHEMKASIEDRNKVSKDWQVALYSVDMRGYDMILGYPWLCEADPDVRWREATWTYRLLGDTGQKFDVDVCDAEEFATLATLAVEDGGHAYCALPYQLYPTLPISTPRYADDLAAKVGSFTFQDETGLPSQVEDLADVFSEALSDSLNTHDQVEHPIDLEPGKTLKSGPIYNMSQDELAAIREYLSSALEKGWIRPSTSSCGSPVLFVKKPDGSLRLCVDYRGLNAITIKNKYPLPLLSEMLDRFAHARRYTKIDIRNAYHRIRVKKGDEWKTAFRTRYGQYEYQVMPFGLVNAPATFQSYVNEALKPYLDDFCVVYLDDVLIYSETEEEHWIHVRKVLKALLAYRLYAKLSKCAFNRTEVTFLGFVVGEEGVQMEQSRIEAVAEWPLPQSAKDILVFLGFAGFYRRFVKGFSQIAAPLTDLTRGAKKGAPQKPFIWSSNAQEAFDKLKRVFTSAPILRHFDWKARIRMETDASNRGAGGVLSQLCEDDQWHPIAFTSYKFKNAEINWDTHDKELFAIVHGFTTWRHYLQGSCEPICVITDHKNLRYFMTTKELNARQVRWAEKLSAYDFYIEYRKGKLNPADGPSRRPDLMKPDGSEENNDAFLPTLQNKLRIREFQPEVQENTGVPATVRLSALFDDMELDAPFVGRSGTSRLLVQRVLEEERAYLEMPEPMVDWLAKLQKNSDFVQQELWKKKKFSKPSEKALWGVSDDGLLRRGPAVYVPENVPTREEILRMNHDDPSAGHFAAKRTIDAIKRKYYWLGMGKDIEEYVRTCSVCQRVRVHHHKPYGKLNPIPPGGEDPFSSVTMDFITDLPPAKDPYTGKTSDAICVLVDKLTKHGTYVATTKDLNAEGLADLLWREFVCNHGMMRDLISDRGSLFTSNFWQTLLYHLGAKRRLSTAYHPQTDGQTERQNQTLEHYLRVYCNFKQDNWPELLPMAMFAYNNSKHASTGKTPNELLRGYLPHLGQVPEDRNPKGEAPLATERAEWLRGSREYLKALWQKVAGQQAKQYDAHHKELSFVEGDKVLVRSVNMRTLRPKKKIDHRQLGPFKVLKKVGSQAYKLDLPESFGTIHPTFHVSLLEPWHARGDEDPEPQPILVEGEEEWEVEKVLDVRTRRSKLEYLVQWVDSPPYERSWEPVYHLDNAKGAIKAFEAERAVYKPTAKGVKRRGRPRKERS